MQLSKKQQAMFWRAFAPAWQEHCTVAGADPDDRAASDAWRHAIILQEAGVTSLADVGRGAGFDRLLKRLALESGDYARAADMEAAESARIRERCEDCMRQICEIEGRETPQMPQTGADGATAATRWAYIERVAAQAWRGRSWLDIPEHDLAKVFMMLDTFRRTLLKRAGWLGGRRNPDQPLGFAPGRRFGRDGVRVFVLAELP